MDDDAKAATYERLAEDPEYRQRLIDDPGGVAIEEALADQHLERAELVTATSVEEGDSVIIPPDARKWCTEELRFPATELVDVWGTCAADDGEGGRCGGVLIWVVPAPLAHPYHPTAVPYRDANGDVVTITEDQFNAIWHAITEWNRLCEAEGSVQHKPWRMTSERPGYGSADADGQVWINLRKSRALGRLLLDGKPLFADRPPTALAAADYGLWDEENGQA